MAIVINKKKVYAGKYDLANPRGQGYFGRNDAGNLQEFVSKEFGVKREFVGSNTQEYTFQDTTHGVHTFTAENYEDALRQASAMGYTASDYRNKRRKRGK